MIFKPSKGVQHKSGKTWDPSRKISEAKRTTKAKKLADTKHIEKDTCLLYTSPSPRDS